jgi:hypothetical protein
LRTPSDIAGTYGQHMSDWFTEGFDMRDLKEAKKLFEELAI